MFAGCNVLPPAGRNHRTRFGGIPGSLPVPHLPVLSLAGLQAALPNALTFTLLGAIESLLSAMVADGMTGRLIAPIWSCGPGASNIASALLAASRRPAPSPARPPTSAPRRSPVAGMAHSLFLVAFMLIAGASACFIRWRAVWGSHWWC